MKRLLAIIVATLLLTPPAYAARPTTGPAADHQPKAPVKVERAEKKAAARHEAEPKLAPTAVHGKAEAKGKHKFEFEGTVDSVSAASLSVVIKSATNTLRTRRGSAVEVQVGASTKIIRKGEMIALSDILPGDRVHVRGGMSTDTPPVLTATRIKVKPVKLEGPEPGDETSDTGNAVTTDTLGAPETSETTVEPVTETEPESLINSAISALDSVLGWLRSLL